MVENLQSDLLPGRLVNFEEARAKHGSQADLMAEMLQVGDPLADAVISEINELGKPAREELNKGLTDGLDTLDDPPPAVAAFLAHLENVPECVYHDSLVAGNVASLSIPPLWATLSSAASQLIHTYASPSISRLLVQTGPMATMAGRRVAETGLWELQTKVPGGLLRGGPGYVHTAQVRLLHARVRATTMKHGWDHLEWGLPINQVDIARTWLDFTVVPFLAREKLGITFTEDEQFTFYRYWSYVGHLLGLDDRFHLHLRSNADAENMRDLLDSTITGPDENSRLLTDALLDAAADGLTAGPMPMDRAAMLDLLQALVRHVFGDEFADALHLPHAKSAELLPLLIAASAQSWQLQRSTPEGAAVALEQFTAMTVAAAAQGFPDGTTYQKHAAGSQ